MLAAKTDRGPSASHLPARRGIPCQPYTLSDRVTCVAVTNHSQQVCPADARSDCRCSPLPKTGCLPRCCASIAFPSRVVGEPMCSSCRSPDLVAGDPMCSSCRGPDFREPARCEAATTNICGCQITRFAGFTIRYSSHRWLHLPRDSSAASCFQGPTCGRSSVNQPWAAIVSAVFIVGDLVTIL